MLFARISPRVYIPLVFLHTGRTIATRATPSSVLARACFIHASRFNACRTVIPGAIHARCNSSSTMQSTSPEPITQNPPFYTGPLAKTFRSLKLLSLTSLGLVTSISPIMFIIESPLPMSARYAMAATAFLMSGASTALIGWCGAPYVGSMRRIPGYKKAPDGGVEIMTKSLLLRDLRTTVKDITFLGQTSRPFATWELISLIRVKADAIRKDGAEEVVAQTTGKDGQIRGVWRVQWESAKDDESFVVGQANAVGKVVRHFNVHEELLKGDETA